MCIFNNSTLCDKTINQKYDNISNNSTKDNNDNIMTDQKDMILNNKQLEIRNIYKKEINKQRKN